MRSATHSVAKLASELLNDKTKTARHLVEHGVAETPVRLRRDLLLCLPGRHFQLQKRVEVIRVSQNRAKTPHFLRAPAQDADQNAKFQISEPDLY